MRLPYGVLFLAFVAGCDAAAPPPPPTTEPPSLERPTSRHSVLLTPHSASLTGRVLWSGPVPKGSPVVGFRSHPDLTFEVLNRPAPNIPAIGADGGIRDAVVFLRGIDPATARCWDRPPVTVELHDERPMVRQGDGSPTTVGFVRHGDEITVVSRQPLFHSLRARGAAFWTLTLPEPNRPRTRRLDRSGLVELSSGVNYFWMHAYLWVCDHPYYTTTDAAGRWTLAGVPTGEYDLVTWLPNWRTERSERDPETGTIARYVFKPHLEAVRRVVVGDGAMTVDDISVRP